jgi:hypothetical protein
MARRLSSVSLVDTCWAVKSVIPTVSLTIPRKKLIVRDIFKVKMTWFSKVVSFFVKTILFFFSPKVEKLHFKKDRF